MQTLKILIEIETKLLCTEIPQTGGMFEKLKSCKCTCAIKKYIEVVKNVLAFSVL